MEWVLLAPIAVFVGIPVYCAIGKLMCLTLLDLFARLVSILGAWDLDCWHNGYKTEMEGLIFNPALVWPLILVVFSFWLIYLVAFRFIWLIWQGLKLWHRMNLYLSR